VLQKRVLINNKCVFLYTSFSGIFVLYFSDRQDGYLAIDNQEIVEGSSKGSYTMLNTNKIIYIGKYWYIKCVCNS